MTCYYLRHSTKRAKHRDMGRVLSHDPFQPLLHVTGLGQPDTGESGPAHIPTWGHPHMPLPCHLNSTPVHRKRNCRRVTAEGWNSPQTYTPPGQEILSCSLLCPDCLKQYLNIVNGQYLFVEWVNVGSTLLKHWLASPGSSTRKTLETFLVKLRPAVLNQDVITTAELWVGHEPMPRGSK